MGKQNNTTALELANVLLTGTFGATGVSAILNFIGYANFAMWGTFVGTVQIQKSFDGGTTWIPVSLDTSGDPANYSTVCTVPIFEIEPGMLYRLQCTAYTSGTISYRISTSTTPLGLYKLQ